MRYQSPMPPKFIEDRISVTMITEYRDGTTTAMTVDVHRDNVLESEIAILNAFRRLMKLHGMVETKIDEEDGI